MRLNKISAVIPGGLELVPVTLDEMKSFLKMDEIDTEDDLIVSLITAATERAEKWTKRKFITQTWDMILDSLERLTEMPWGQLQSVWSIHTRDEDFVETLLDPINYVVDRISDPGLVILKTTAYLPYHTSDSGIRIRFECGYGADGALVPAGIKIAIMLIAAYWYEHRGSQVIPNEAMNILSTYEIVEI